MTLEEAIRAALFEHSEHAGLAAHLGPECITEAVESWIAEHAEDCPCGYFDQWFKVCQDVNALEAENERLTGLLADLTNQSFGDRMALISIVNETDGQTYGKPGYDATLDNIHDVAKAALDKEWHDGSWEVGSHGFMEWKCAADCGACKEGTCNHVGAHSYCAAHGGTGSPTYFSVGTWVTNTSEPSSRHPMPLLCRLIGCTSPLARWFAWPHSLCTRWYLRD